MDKKTLYVSDLDGTLFNGKKRITDYTADILNQCMGKGMKFTVATARMPYGCDYRLENIQMNTPGILTNGVFLYDFREEKIISAEEIHRNGVEEVIDIFRNNGLGCFVYTYDDRGISIYYEGKGMEAQTQYYSDRALEKCARVSGVADVKKEVACRNVVYIAYTGKREELEPFCRKLDKVKGVDYSFYLNVYNGWYCLEIFSADASKKNALMKLKRLMSCENVVVFGDNLNDISMFEIADRSYAPANALDEVKEMADGVLEDCDHDGVARFLADEWKV